MNLLHRVDSRNTLEEAASNVINDLFRINTLMLREYKAVGKVSSSSQISKLQKSVKLNLKYVKELKRELEFFKLETLYFEDDMIGKLDSVRNIEKDIIKKAIAIEGCFKEIMLDTGILQEKRLRDPNIRTKYIIEREIVTTHDPAQQLHLLPSLHPPFLRHCTLRNQILRRVRYQKSHQQRHVQSRLEGTARQTTSHRPAREERPSKERLLQTQPHHLKLRMEPKERPLG